MPSRLRTVFMGSDPIVLPLLDSIRDRHADVLELTGLFTQPDRPHGRGMKLQENPVARWGRENGIPVFQPEKPGPEETRWLCQSSCDLLLVMAYGHLLKSSLLEAPRLPPLNFHASLLPELRGASPIETAIATGKKETGVTLMRIEKKMDAGDILDVEKVPVCTDDDRAVLAGKLAQACIPLLTRALPALQEETLRFTPQDGSKSTYCRILTKGDAAMDFAVTAQELHDRNRAFRQWPGTGFDYEGQRIKVGETAVIREETNALPGTVLASGKTLDVATGSGTLRMLRLQRPGGKMLSAADFLRGMPIPVGTVMESHPMQPLERSC